MERIKKLLCLVVGLILVLSMAACAAKSADRADTATQSSPVDMSGGVGELKLDFNEDVSMDSLNGSGSFTTETAYDRDMEEPQSIGASSYSGNVGNSLDILAQRKVIRNANLTLEVEDFYKTYGQIQTMINGIGFIQEANIRKDDYYYEGERNYVLNGYVTIRIMADKFDNIVNGINDMGDLIEQNISSSDITDQFFDTEGRLEVLQIEYDYLENYLKSLHDADDIFKTQKRLTEVRTEIEKLTGTLKKWSDLVELSTIMISIQEKLPEEVKSSKPDTYWERLLGSVKDSLYGVVDAFGELIIFVIEAIPTLVVLGVIGLFGWKMYIRYKKKKSYKNLPAPEDKKE